MASSPASPQSLVLLAAPRSPAAEAFRQLRTAIQHHRGERPPRTILVSSTGVDEGKTTAVANLAIALAQAGQRVVLVDCDLRRPSIHSLFGLAAAPGLSEALQDASGKELPLQAAQVPGLTILAAGAAPPNPSELLESSRMGEILSLLRSQADYVLCDSPPALPVTDAAVLAPQVDGVILVLKAGKTRREPAQRAKAIFDQVGANLLGVVLNDARDCAGTDSYYHERRTAER